MECKAEHHRRISCNNRQSTFLVRLYAPLPWYYTSRCDCSISRRVSDKHALVNELLYMLHYSSMSGVDDTICSTGCNCSSTTFEPVCGNDGITYFSACRAGCTTSFMEDNVRLIIIFTLKFYSCIFLIIIKGESLFRNCSCILSGGINDTATTGKCESTCVLLAPALLLFIISIIFAFITSIPYQYFILRSVILYVHYNRVSIVTIYLYSIIIQSCV